jgi:hydroxyacylglutathione hydrolase
MGHRPAHPDRVRYRLRAGTFNFGIDGQFATYLGWLIPWGIPVTLLGESTEQFAEAQRELVRIGIDRPAAAATDTPKAWTDRPLDSFELATFADLAQVRHHRLVAILDVRRVGEWTESHIAGAMHIPIHDLLSRIAEVPNAEVWVHCAASYRACAAASILAARDARVVVVNDSYAEQAADSGPPLITAALEREEAVA